jgi:hypothetical protein
MDQRVIEMGKFLDAPEDFISVPLRKEADGVLEEDDCEED